MLLSMPTASHSPVGQYPRENIYKRQKGSLMILPSKLRKEKGHKKGGKKQQEEEYGTSKLQTVVKSTGQVTQSR